MKASDLENAQMSVGDMDDSFFLIGVMSEFVNRFQAVTDRFFQEISWKQCFVLACMQFFKEPPTINQLSEVVGSTHQNVKQILNKLEKVGFVEMRPDPADRRKCRIIMTEKAMAFNEESDGPSKEYMGELFAGVDPENLKITIQTIMQLDEQLKQMKIER